MKGIVGLSLFTMLGVALGHPANHSLKFHSKPEYSCPDGFTLEGVKCVKFEYEDASALCLRGELLGDQCISSIDLSKKCPEGYEQSGKECTKLIPVDTVPECKDDEELVGKICQKTLYLDPICPKGYSDNGKNCVINKPLLEKCPDGYRRSGKNCIKEDPVEREPVCDEGELIDGICKKSIYLDPICPSSFTDSGKKCIKSSNILTRCPEGFKRKGKDCFRDIPVERVPECRDDEELVDGNKCRKVTYVDPICPKGYKDNGKNCIQTQSLLKKCPEGFKSVGKSCLKDIPVEKLPKCAKGELLKGKCIETIYLDPICPNGYIEDGKKCIRKSAVLKKCPSGYRMAGKKCLKETVLAKIPECPEGTELIGKDKCQKINILEQICPSGTISQGKNCIKQARPTKHCPKGYALSKNECVRITTLEKIPECPEDMVLNGSKCEKTIYLDKICPAGTFEESKNKSDQCIIEARLLKRCQDGFFESNGKCLKITKVDLVPKCKDKFTLTGNNKCEKIIPGSFVPFCKIGDLVEGQCLQTENVAKTYSCPKGYNLTGGNRCSTEQEFDCSETIYESKCTTENACEGKDCHLRSKSYTPVTRCEKVPIVNNKTCSKTLFADAIASCPPGSEASGKGCITSNTSAPDMRCVGGDGNSKECRKVLVEAPAYICPLSGSKSKDCSITDESELIYYCKDDSFIQESNRCVQYHEKVCPGGRCDRIVSITPKYICPDNGNCKIIDTEDVTLKCQDKFSLINENCIQYFDKICPNNGDCRDIIISNANFVCPAGGCIIRDYAEIIDYCDDDKELFDDYCAVFADKVCPGGNCERKLTSAPYFECPVEEINGICKTIDEIDYIYYCLGDFTQLDDKLCAKYREKECPGGKCDRVHLRNANFICPVESVKGQCKTVENADLIRYCQDGYELLGDKCSVFADKVCPNGNCERILTSRPRFVCPVEEQKGKCQTVSTVNIIKYCLAKYVQTGEKCSIFEDKVCPGGNCERILSSKPNYVCPVQSIRGRCATLESVDFDYFCSKGFEQCSSGCCAYTDAVYKCGKGGLLQGKTCEKKLELHAAVSYPARCKGKSCQQ